MKAKECLSPSEKHSTEIPLKNHPDILFAKQDYKGDAKKLLMMEWTSVHSATSLSFTAEKHSPLQSSGSNKIDILRIHIP